MVLKGVKNIILDLGGVIINLKQELTIKAFQDLFGNQFQEIQAQLDTNKYLEKVETSVITTAEFIAFFQNFDTTITPAQITVAWNSMLLDIPKERITLINQLAKQYRVFLLSNTNEIHLNYIDDYVKSNFNLKSMSELFEKSYYSHKMKLRKPNLEIFEAILKDKNLVAEETLFIDDSEEHIITAKKLNLETHHLLDGETLVDIFNVN